MERETDSFSKYSPLGKKKSKRLVFPGTRLRGDLIQVNKIMIGVHGVDGQSLFPMIIVSETRMQRFKMRGRRILRERFSAQ